MKWKHIINVLSIIFLSIVIRLIPFRLDQNYNFLGTTIHYWFKPDRYYYSSIFLDFGFSHLQILYLFFIPTILTLILLYCLMLRLGISPFYSFLGTLFFSFFPYCYNQTMLGYIDTPPLIILIIMISNHFVLTLLSSKNISLRVLMFLGIVILQAVLYWFIWHKSLGAITISLLIFSSIAFATMFRKKILWITSSGISLFLLFIIPYRMMYTVGHKELGVTEYLFPAYMGYLFTSLIVVIICVFNHKEILSDFKMKYLVFSFLGYLVLSFNINRVTVFTMLFAIPLLFLNFKVRSKIFTTIIIICFAFFIIRIDNDFSNINVPMFREYELALNGLDGDHAIVNIWDNGHVINHFTNASVPYRANPTQSNLHNFVNGVLIDEDLGVTYLDRLSQKPKYYLIIYYSDFPKLELYKKYLEYNISKNSVLSGAIRKTPLKYFKLHKYMKYKEEEIWIYERNWKSVQ